MSQLEAPQPSSPFTIGREGLSVVEQGSPEGIVSNIRNVAVCPQGFRDDLPEFGLPLTLNSYYPLDPEIVEEAILRWEPEADFSIEAQRTAIGEATVLITEME